MSSSSTVACTPAALVFVSTRILAICGANTASRIDRGKVTLTAQVSRPEAMRPAVSRSDLASGTASSGMTAPARAPPATTSKRMFGTWLALW